MNSAIAKIIRAPSFALTSVSHVKTRKKICQYTEKSCRSTPYLLRLQKTAEQGHNRRSSLRYPPDSGRLLADLLLGLRRARSPFHARADQSVLHHPGIQ